MQEALPQPPAALDDDDARLQDLGYRPQLRRVLGLSANISVAFSFMAPMIGIFTLFSLGLGAGGPAYLWLTLIPLAGMFLVALVLGELASHYPAAGALYQYGKRTVGAKFGWFTGWFYGIALLVTVAAVDAGAVSYAVAFAHDVFGWNFDATAHGTILVITLVLLVIQTTVNTVGAKIMSRVAQLGVAVGILGTVGIAIVLGVHGFHHGLGFLATTQDVQHVKNNPLGVSFGGHWIAGALVAVLAPAYIFRGFESPGDFAEETRNAGRQVPRAMRLALIGGGIAAFVLTAALLLAMPAGAGTVVNTVQSGGIPYILGSLPSGLQETMLGVIVVAFLACGTAVQGAGSRVVFSFARDGALPGAKSIGALSERFKTPANALFGGALITVLFVGLEFASPTHDVKILWFTYPGSTSILTSLATFAVTGIYLSFLLTVIGSMIARARGWVPAGRAALGRWAWPVSVVAAVYLALMLADLVAPTGLSSARAYVNDGWITLVVMAIIALVGVIVFVTARRGLTTGEQGSGEQGSGGDRPAAAEPVPVLDAEAREVAEGREPGAS
jgi:amino acid transporter